MRPPDLPGRARPPPPTGEVLGIVPADDRRSWGNPEGRPPQNDRPGPPPGEHPPGGAHLPRGRDPGGGLGGEREVDDVERPPASHLVGLRVPVPRLRAEREERSGMFRHVELALTHFLVPHGVHQRVGDAALSEFAAAPRPPRSAAPPWARRTAGSMAPSLAEGARPARPRKRGRTAGIGGRIRTPGPRGSLLKYRRRGGSATSGATEGRPPARERSPASGTW